MAPTHHPSALEQQLHVQQTLFGNKSFDNPIGLAAGFDKDGQIVNSMLQLGFGFVEIGTVTPQPQPGNPKPRMFRLTNDKAIINRYGFNSQGSKSVKQNLEQYYQTIYPELQGDTKEEDRIVKPDHPVLSGTWHALQGLYETLVPTNNSGPRGLLGVNIGKNKVTTDPDAIVQDYVGLIESLGPYADFMVINISSPNTKGLRDLQQGESLERLLRACLQARDKLIVSNTTQTLSTSTESSLAVLPTLASRTLPILVKLAPDLTDQDLLEIANTCRRVGIDGIVVTNTTNQRPKDLVSSKTLVNQMGGLSGKPIKDVSTECIRKLYKYTDGAIPLIGVGGVESGHDAFDKLKAGASLVEIYSTMIYKGPGVVSQIRHELAQLMIQNGKRNIKDVIGMDHEGIFWRRREEHRLLPIRRESKDRLWGPNEDMPTTTTSSAKAVR